MQGGCDSLSAALLPSPIRLRWDLPVTWGGARLCVPCTPGSPATYQVGFVRNGCPHRQTLLREVRTLRDRLCTEDEANPLAAAQRLLQVYRQLRRPSLLLL